MQQTPNQTACSETTSTIMCLKFCACASPAYWKCLDVVTLPESMKQRSVNHVLPGSPPPTWPARNPNVSAHLLSLLGIWEHCNMAIEQPGAQVPARKRKAAYRFRHSCMAQHESSIYDAAFMLVIVQCMRKAGTAPQSTGHTPSILISMACAIEPVNLGWCQTPLAKD